MRLLAVTALGLAVVGAGRAEQPLPHGALRRFGATQFRLTSHSAETHPFRFSPDGKVLAGANGSEVRLWSFPDGELLHDLSASLSRYTNAIAFHPESKHLLGFQWKDKSVWRVDVESGKLVGRTKLVDPPPEQDFARYDFSSDGRWIGANLQHRGFVLWSTQTGKRLFQKAMDRIYAWRVSKSDILTVWSDTELARYDIATGQRVSHRRIWRELVGIVGDAEGGRVAGYSPKDQAIIFWDTAKNERVGAKIAAGEERDWPNDSAVLSADGRRLVYRINKGAGRGMQIAVFDTDTGRVLSSFDPPGAYFTAGPVISPDGRYVFPTQSRSMFCPIDTTTGKPVRERSGHIMSVETLDFTPNVATLLVGSKDRRQAWRVSDGRPGVTFEQSFYHTDIHAIDDHRVLVCNENDGGAQLQNVNSGAIERRFVKDRSSMMGDLQLSVDRTTFVGFADDPRAIVIRRWDLGTGKMIAERPLPPRRGDGEMPVVSEYDCRRLTLRGTRLAGIKEVPPVKRPPDDSLDWLKVDLILEDWETKRITHRFRLPSGRELRLIPSPDEATLAVVMTQELDQGNGRIKRGSTFLQVWDCSTGWMRLEVKRAAPEYHAAFTLGALAPDGRLAATASHDGIEIWNGYTGQLLERFDVGNRVTALAISPNGRLLASGHLDGMVYLWDTASAWERAVPRQRLTPEQLDVCWNDLAGEGRAPALAMQRLLGDPKQAVVLVGQRLKPAAPPDVPALIAQLDAPLHRDRESADAALRRLGDRPRPALNEALAQKPSAEAAARIRRLLADPPAPLTPELRRRVLVVRTLERMGTADARAEIERIARGDAGAPETLAAQAALRRFR